ncbi:monocarboxylate transporter 12 [Eurytemora carolleeae]|uniref:monocarboxylate transporter 12 n=1 Tax=Eurytemora carolleeae TaxID=1294199 RepID=UPI000C785AF9|nr:monocarboxylate transporter 12 [Eurytemora carolleeae]|eukprot:XP_023341259.1 monocarboxylate transporter 12-like [Eurytemora affinis]
MSPTLFNNPNFPTFLICLLADFMAFTGIYIPYTHLPPLAEFRNISSTDAAFLISAGGISNTFGRFLGGWLCDQPAIHPFLVTILSVGLTIIPSFIIPRIVAYRSFISMFSVFGLATGCTMGSTSPLLLRLLGLKALSQTFGLITASRGIAALVGPPLAGLLVDLLDEPGIAIDLVGFLEILALFFYIIAVGRNRVVQRRRNYQQL